MREREGRRRDSDTGSKGTEVYREKGQGEERGSAMNEGLHPSSPGCPWGIHATEGAFRFGDSAPNSAKISFLKLNLNLCEC